MNQVQPECLCRKSGRHSNQSLQYFCLQRDCILDRLLCKICVQQNHFRHNVGMTDKLISPLNRLSMNSFESPESYHFFQDKIKVICEEWSKLNEVVYESMRKLQQGIMFQLRTLMGTFKTENIDKTHSLFLRNDSDLKKVNECIAMIKFLEENNFSDCEKLKKYSDLVIERVQKVINKTTDKIKIVLGRMQEHIESCDFNHFKNFVAKDEKIEETEDDEKKNQKNISQKKNNLKNKKQLQNKHLSTKYNSNYRIDQTE